MIAPTFRKAYEASLRLSEELPEEPTDWQITQRIFDAATVDEYLIALKMEAGFPRFKAVAWLKEMKSIYGRKGAVVETTREKERTKVGMNIGGKRYTLVGQLPKPAPTKTPQEWCKELGKTILDPDGWRGSMYKDYNEPITEAEFRWRLQTCTQSFKNTKPSERLPDGDVPF